jgi:D-alanine-D-alanine ligase
MVFRSRFDEPLPGQPSRPGERARKSLGRVAVLIDRVAESAAADLDPEAPVQSTGAVMEALSIIGYETVELPVEGARRDRFVRRLLDGDFSLVFNLCESVGGRSAEELLFCLHKDRSAAVLRANGIAVPDWLSVEKNDPLPENWGSFPAIVKPAAEDGSNGVHPASLVHSRKELYSAVARLRRHWGKVLVQQYIDGRELNLAIVGARLLPPAEIDFSRLPDGSPPIVTFAAKWCPGSPEDEGTRPVCPAQLPARKSRELQRLAARAWRLMHGHGYARVDVRLAADGTPYVIDINPNPDLSRDAGLARQARAAGWSYEKLIRQIVRDAQTPRRAEGATEGKRSWTIVPAAASQEGAV